MSQTKRDSDAGRAVGCPTSLLSKVSRGRRRRSAVALNVVLLASFTGIGMFWCSPAEALVATCTVSATSINFGTYTATNTLADDSVGTVTVTCQGAVGLLVGYTVTLTPGNSGSFASRTLLNSSFSLTYQVYTDALHLFVFGDGTGGTATVVGGYLLSVLGPVVQTYPYYGHIPARQVAAPGVYTDTMVLMVSF